jgi:hypothetical protein
LLYTLEDNGPGPCCQLEGYSDTVHSRHRHVRLKPHWIGAPFSKIPASSVVANQCLFATLCISREEDQASGPLSSVPFSCYASVSIYWCRAWSHQFRLFSLLNPALPSPNPVNQQHPEAQHKPSLTLMQLREHPDMACVYSAI